MPAKLCFYILASRLGVASPSFPYLFKLSYLNADADISFFSADCCCLM